MTYENRMAAIISVRLPNENVLSLNIIVLNIAL